MEQFTLKKDSKGLRINGQLCFVRWENGIVTIQSKTTGIIHSCHPCIDKTDSVTRMIKSGYWDKGCRTAIAGPFLYNISAFEITNELDLLAYHIQEQDFKLPDVQFGQTVTFQLQQKEV